MNISIKSISPKYFNIGDILIYMDEDINEPYLRELKANLGEHFTEQDLKDNSVFYYKIKDRPVLVDDDYFESEILWINRPEYYDEDDNTMTFDNASKKRVFLEIDSTDYNIVNKSDLIKIGIFTIISIGLVTVLSFFNKE